MAPEYIAELRRILLLAKGGTGVSYLSSVGYFLDKEDLMDS